MAEITGQTQLLGVMGHPVRHSLSPVMHNAVLRAIAEDYTYVAFPVDPDQVAVALAGLGAIGVRGVNVTLPHKQAVIPFLKAMTPVAQQVGAVNTLRWEGDGWWGTNTDVVGFITPLQAWDLPWQTMKPMVLGHGGSARAVVVGLAQLGCSQITVVGRDGDRLRQFCDSWSTVDLGAEVTGILWEALAGQLPQTDLVINTTPVGMAPHHHATPIAADLFGLLPPTAIAYDLIYTPRPTQFLQMAQARGLRTLDGLGMLIHQGAAALEHWLHRSIPVAVMEEALLTHFKLNKGENR